MYNEPWKCRILTLYPGMFPGPLGFSLAGDALDQGKWMLETVDIRRFAGDKHSTVDDAPYGGGPGMVMRPDVLDSAIRASGLENANSIPLIYLSPRGKRLTQQRVRELAEGSGLVVICGRFEGIDERILESHNIEELSVGDYILSGGEPAAIVLLDTIVRLLPGVVGQSESTKEESFELGLLEYPHYTRPSAWNGFKVPEVLLSGNHEQIRSWRRAQSEKTTKERRPDLWQAFEEFE